MTDELTRRLRELPPPDLDTPPDRVEQVFARARQRRVRRAAALSAAAAAVLIAAVAVALPRGGGRQSLHEVQRPGPAPSAPTPARSSPPAPGPQPATASVAPGPLGGPARFIPVSMSFVSARDGYAWGPAWWPTAAGAPGVLARTSDGGHSWTTVATPAQPRVGAPGSADHVLFADARHGYLYGSALYRTSDGGTHWQRVPTPGSILGATTSGASVFLIVCMDSGCTTSRLFAAAVGAATPQAVPAVPTMLGRAAVTTANGQVYLLATRQDASPQATSLLAHSSDGQHWTFDSLPAGCPRGENAALAGYPADGLALVCGGQPGAGNQVKTAYRSSDGGLHWARQSPLPSPGYVGTLAAADATTWVLAETRGGLLVTHDGGRTWADGQPNATLANTVDGWGDVVFTTASDAVAVPAEFNGALVAVSADRGDTWTTVRFTPSTP